MSFGKNMSLDPRSQKQNVRENVEPFMCHEGVNHVSSNSKAKPFKIRAWSGHGLVVYAGNGMVEVKGYSEPMDEHVLEQFDTVIKKAHKYVTEDA